MISPRVKSPVKEEEIDVDGAKGDGAEWEGKAADPDYLDLNFASLLLTVALSMAHMKVK